MIDITSTESCRCCRIPISSQAESTELAFSAMFGGGMLLTNS